MEANLPAEKPISSGSKALLMCGAAAAVIIFYLLSLISVLAVLLVLSFEFLLFLVALRFGYVAPFVRMMERSTAILRIYFHSFRLSKGADFRTALAESDAPELFTVLRDLGQRLQIKPPELVYLQMDMSASIHLKGLRSGRGQTTLMLGYDLLAGLSKSEVISVLAHEMAHAKLVQRGFSGWVFAGFARLANLTNGLWYLADSYKQAKKSYQSVEFFWRGWNWLTRVACLQIRAYSRQDEFEADRGAAELCGTATTASALSKLDSLAAITSRLPWRERVARLQIEGGYTKWLREEIAQGVNQPMKEQAAVFNKYATHPNIRDRIAALPQDGSTIQSEMTSGIDFLREPDKTVMRLIVEIQRELAELERKESKSLQKWLRKHQRGANLQPVQLVGVAFFVFGMMLSIALLVQETKAPLSIFMILVLLVGGVFLYRTGRYKDKRPLPVPDYTSFIKCWKKLKELDIPAKEVERIEADYQKLTANESRKKKQYDILIPEAYSALSRGDYVHALLASRLCVMACPKRAEGLAGFFIACAALNKEQTAEFFGFLKGATGLRTTEAMWAAAWGLTLAGDFQGAEAFLDKLLKQRPQEATWRMLLALVLAKRGKLQSAIKNAREAFEIRPADEEGAQLFISLLIENGYFREAQERLESLNQELQNDIDVMFLHVRALLVQQKHEEATQWAERIKEKAPDGQSMLKLGAAYEEARQYAYANGCYYRALEMGYYPAAYVGMGRIEAQRLNHGVAEAYFLGALELSRPLGKDADGVPQVFPEAIGRLMALRDPALNCRAWVVSLAESMDPPALSNLSFLVYAQNRETAEQYFEALFKAFRKGMPPALPGQVTWREATAQQQPDGPVCPGVQCVLT